jgi:hypothetical protein
MRRFHNFIQLIRDHKYNLKLVFLVEFRTLRLVATGKHLGGKMQNGQNNKLQEFIQL